MGQTGMHNQGDLCFGLQFQKDQQKDEKRKILRMHLVRAEKIVSTSQPLS
jgi:hypothetical protein